MAFDSKIAKMACEAQECLRHAVYDAMVERAKHDLSFDICNRGLLG